MESIIARISQGQFWDFHGGIHPPEQKTMTTNKPIKQLSLPKQLIIPLQQHIGQEGDLIVNVGDHVLKGQALTNSTNPMIVPVHAPTSGIISEIKDSIIAHPSALKQKCIFLDVDGEDKWREKNICSDLKQLTNNQIIEKIADAGIAGMGGAGFPTHIKVNCKPDINFLIINGVECEPYITSDDLLMMEQSNAIIDGIEILDRLLSPAFILIAIEDNKPKAIKALQQASVNIEKIKVCVVPTKYPSGGEKQLIQILTGKEVSAGRLPLHSGIVMQNVATCFAINDAVRHDIPLIKRVVTVTGQGLNKPQNVWALLGTPVKFLLEQCAHEPVEGIKQPVIMGGPMMGFSVANDLVPIVKTSNCILVPNKKEMPSAFETQHNEVECIRCGQCSDVCPSQLLPQELQWSAKAKDNAQLEKLNLKDCIECGACAYVCPSQIPLVHYYRIAKAEIREQHQLDLKAEKAKARFEARKLRLEKEKIARQEKHKAAAAARKAAMNKATPEATGAKSAVAAALARVKAKKAAKGNSPKTSQESNSEQLTTNKLEGAVNAIEDDQKSTVAAAIARAKAKKILKESQAITNPPSVDDISKGSPTMSEPQVELPDNADPTKAVDKKTRIAAAVARAKAKKNAKAIETTDKEKLGHSSSKATEDKTQQADTESTDSANSDSGRETNKSVDKSKVSEPVDKKARIAAAVAKAKAKKKQKDKKLIDENPVTNDQERV